MQPRPSPPDKPIPPSPRAEKVPEDGPGRMETLPELLENDLVQIALALQEEFEAMEGSNLLITGGGGFLGYYLVQSALFWNERAAHHPIHVTVVDNYRRGVPDWLLDLTGQRNLAL